MIKAIVFDFDGVLVSSENIKTEAFGKLFKDEGEEISKKVVEYHLDNAGVSRFDKFRYIYKEMLRRELTEEVFNGLCDGFSKLVMEDVVAAPYVPGAKEFLDAHHTTYNCFVSSATPQDEIEEIVLQRGMAHYFKEVYGAPLKKDKAVNMILDAYNLKNNEVVFVGDAVSDYKAAQKSSVFFVARLTESGYQFESEQCPKMQDLTFFSEYLKEFEHE